MINLTFCRARKCKDFAYDRNLCHKHYAQRYRSEKYTPRINGNVCLADNCANKSIGRGLCWKHYRRQLRSYYKRATMACLIFHSLPHWLLYLQDHPIPKLNFDDLEKPKKVRRIPKPPHPNAKPCSIPGCDDYVHCRGVCHKHYEYMQYHGTLPPKVIKPVDCAVDGCQGKRESRGFCQKHYTRFKRYGTVDLDKVDGRSAKVHHGMTETRTYRSWASMIQRCYNPKSKAYKYYGQRGIVVCERWRSFANFYADMGKRPENTTLHRHDVNGNYEPGNCKWATTHEQALRKRLPSTNKSGYRGVHFDRGAWTASISLNNKATYLGRSKNKEEAARLYNQAAIVHFGAEAMLNQV